MGLEFGRCTKGLPFSERYRIFADSFLVAQDC